MSCPQIQVTCYFLPSFPRKREPSVFRLNATGSPLSYVNERGRQTVFGRRAATTRSVISFRIRLPLRRGRSERRQRIALRLDPREGRIRFERNAGATRIGELRNEAAIGQRGTAAMAELAGRGLARELRFERTQAQIDPVTIPGVLRRFARAKRAQQIAKDAQ